MEIPLLDELDIPVWNLYWTEVERRIGPFFARSQARHHAVASLCGGVQRA
jgi:hypothetical protein